ncbi:MAG: hypothetical protein DMF60_05235 [Acidobacteria bacterium]|nr:MAG: hypothetical protein DMF60_05235 [Acidobacteriota bacterium]
MAGSAPRQLLTGLMSVTGIAIGMFWHAGLEPFAVKAVTDVAFYSTVRHLPRIHLALHLLRVHVVAMRKPLQTKLRHPRRELYKRGFGGRRLVADYAHLAFQVRKVFRMTFEAGRMAGQHRLWIVTRTLMASATVLGFGFVFFAVVIERRNGLDNFGVNYLEGRLACRGRRRVSAFGRLVHVLLRALAGPQADEQNYRHRRHYSL